MIPLRPCSCCPNPVVPGEQAVRRAVGGVLEPHQTPLPRTSSGLGSAGPDVATRLVCTLRVRRLPAKLQLGENEDPATGSGPGAAFEKSSQGVPRVPPPQRRDRRRPIGPRQPGVQPRPQSGASVSAGGVR